MGESTLALFAGAPGELSLERRPLPALGPGEILVRILGCTLCGSDLHTVAGRRSVAVPTVLGHEIVGEVAAFGPGAPRHDIAGTLLAEGTAITWAIVAGCGECFYCTHDLWPKCERGVKYGHDRAAAGSEFRGGLAEHCILVPGTAIVALPAGMALEVACPANCATATVVAALEAAGDLSGACVAILGAGLLGLTAAALAQARGARDVIVVDTRAGRAARAAEFGATAVGAPGDLPGLVAAATAGRGADVLLELTGATAALAGAWEQVRIGGTIVLVGAVSPDAPWRIVPERIVRRALSIRGIHNYSPRHLAAAVAFLATAQDRHPFASLVSAWYPLADVTAAFSAAAAGSHVRVGIRPG
ncbi:MAG: zinc-binding dehydrogenase [Planctomycetota bacterium]